ncbi:hypothetical protein UT300012_22270 [Paraclostridium bifermentans]
MRSIMVMNIEDFKALKSGRLAKFISKVIILGSIVFITITCSGLVDMVKDISSVPAILYMKEHDSKNVMPSLHLPKILKERNMDTVQASEFSLNSEKTMNAAEFK